MTTCDIGDRTCGTGEWTGPQPGDPDNSLSISAAPSFGGIDVTWSYPGVNPHAVAHVQLYRSATNVFESAVQIALVAGTFFHDQIDAVGTYYYWIRVVSIHGTLGAPVGPASATSRLLIGDMIEKLTGEIDAGLLAESLKGKLDEISILNDNLAAEIFDRESGQTSFAEALADVQAGVAEAHTFIANEIANRVDEQGAIIEQINMVAATAEDQVAQVLVTTQAWVDTVDNKAGALWSARLTANNLVGGFGIYNDGSTVEAGFDVDTFWVGRTNADKRKPFIISGGVTYIDQAMIEQLHASKITAGSITTTQLQVGSASVVAGSNMVYNSWSPGGGFTGGLLTGSTAVTINTTGTPVSINCSVNVSAAASNPAVAYYLVTSYLVLDNVLYGNLFATTYMPAIGGGGWAKRGFASLPIVVRGGPAAGWHAFRIDTYFEPRDAAGNPVSHGSGFIDQHVYMTVTENKV